MASAPVAFKFSMDDNFSGRLASIQAAVEQMGPALLRLQTNLLDRIEIRDSGEPQRWVGDDG